VLRIELIDLQAQIDEQQAMSIFSGSLPTPEDFAEELKLVSEKILVLDASAAALLPKLAPVIRAVPYRQLGTPQIYLRAEFELMLAELLPDQLLDMLHQRTAGVAQTELRVPVSVDLFSRPQYVKDAERCLPLLKGDATIKGTAVGNALGITKLAANRARVLAMEMLANATDDPYVRQVEAPAAASRWRLQGS
jgi:hypothetical protein